MKPFFFTFVLLGLLVYTPLKAADNQYGIWLSATTSGKFGSADNTPWMWSLEGQYRFFDTFDGSRQLMARSFVGYILEGGWRVGMRYDRFNNRTERTGTFYENRYSPLVQWSGNGPGDSTIQLRGLLEFRDVEGRSGTGIRFRPRVRLEWPMESVNNAIWVAWLEPFFDVKNVTWADTGKNQFRAFFGARFPMTEKTKLEIGYQNVWANPFGDRDILNHTIFAQFRF